MKIIRYLDRQSQIHLAAEGANGEHRVLDVAKGDIFSGFRLTDETAQIAKLLAPIVPTAIICIGLNYREHARETSAPIPRWPVVFMKFPNALQNPDDAIVLPRHLASEQVDYEGELVVLIGKTCKNVRRENALDYVFGYTIGNDVSARDWQKDQMKSGTQWCRAKSFDTFAPLGPCVVTRDAIPNPNALALNTRVNGEVLQRSNTSDMIFSVTTLVEFLSGSTTLLPGTAIFTGTPSGVGMARTPPRWLQNGDIVEIEIENIGVLRNRVELERVENES